MKRFPELHEVFGDLAQPVHVVQIYGLKDPAPTWVRDGGIDTYYFHSQIDQVDTYSMDKEGPTDEVLEKVFALNAKDAFHYEGSSISYFLRDKLGID